MSLTDKEFEKLPEWKKNIMESRYQQGLRLTQSGVENALADIDKRLNQLEHKVFKQNKRMQITTAQKIITLNQLGILQHFNELGLSKNMLAQLMAILLNEDADKIEKSFRVVGLKKSTLHNIANYEVVLKVFESIGFEKHEIIAQNKLNDIKAAEGK